MIWGYGLYSHSSGSGSLASFYQHGNKSCIWGSLSDDHEEYSLLGYNPTQSRKKFSTFRRHVLSRSSYWRVSQTSDQENSNWLILDCCWPGLFNLPEYGDSMFLRKVREILHDYPSSHLSSNKTLGSVKVVELLHQLSAYQLLKASTPRN
jgi:hypothetical protein